MKVKDLFADLGDGMKLLTLLEKLTGTKIKGKRHTRKERHFKLENVSGALEFLRVSKVKVVWRGGLHLFTA